MTHKYPCFDNNFSTITFWENLPIEELKYVILMKKEIFEIFCNIDFLIQLSINKSQAYKLM